MARIRSVLGDVPARAKPAIRISPPVPTRVRAERFVKRSERSV